MNSFKLHLNKLHTSLENLGITNLSVSKKGHQVVFEGYTNDNIKLLLKLEESFFAQSSPASWSYCANPDSDLWIQRTSFLQGIPDVVQDIISNKRFDSKYLNTLNEKKKEGHKYEYGCLMALVDDKDWDTDFVDDKDLYFAPDEPKDQYGKETEPHVTVLFGFHQDEIDMEDIKKFVEKIKPIEDIKLTGISCFHNDKYDVLKYDVDSETLHDLNKKVRDQFPYTNDYPDYHPHMTVAYLKPGEGKKYEEKFEKPKEIGTITKLKYSYPSGEKKFYDLVDDKPVNESNDNYWTSELSEIAYFVGEFDKDLDVTFSSSKEDPYLTVNGKIFPVSFMESGIKDEELGMTLPGEQPTIAMIHSEDDLEKSVDYTIGSKDASSVYDFIISLN